MSAPEDRPTSILFVCTGNICRSPIGERVLRDLAAWSGAQVTVTSAGVGAANGQPMHPSSVEVLTEHGYDAAGFESRYLRPQILEESDLVLTMTREHRAACQRALPARWRRMFTLAEFVKLLGDAPADAEGLSELVADRGRVDTNADDLDIADPMGKPTAEFERCFAEIEPLVGSVAAWLGGDGEVLGRVGALGASGDGGFDTASASASTGSTINDSVSGGATGNSSASGGATTNSGASGGATGNDSASGGATTNSGASGGATGNDSASGGATGNDSASGEATGNSSASGGEDTKDGASGGSHRRRRMLIGSGIVVALIVVVVGWLAYSAFGIKSDLEDARVDANAARKAVLSGDQDAATSRAQAAASSAKSASDRAHGVVWAAAASVPLLGSPLKSVQEMSDTVADFATEVLVPTADLGAALDPSELRRGDTIGTAPLAAAQPQLAKLAAASDVYVTRVEGIDPSWLGQVADARDELYGLVHDASGTLNGSNVAAQLLPAMTGADGPRNYFVALQTPSESRGTGGLVGGFAILNATKGRLTAPELGANNDFRYPTTPQTDLGSDFNSLYATFHPYTDFRNANMSPSFPDAAQIWIANWHEVTGEQLDGAIALDPIALSYVLKVTGPLTLPGGEKITADNVVPITLSTSYERFADNNQARKDYLQSISKAAVKQLSTFKGDTSALLEALGRGVHERRIMVYSTDPDEEKILQTTNLGHEIGDVDAPYASVTIQNAGGNKLDYYLRRKLEYVAAGCSSDKRDSVITMQLTNTLDDLSLPDYVIAPNGTAFPIDKGTALSNVEFLLSKGATVKGVFVDDQEVLYQDGTLGGHPYVGAMVQVPPGKTVTVKVFATEPTWPGEAVVPVQPLVDNPEVTVRVPECGS
ncbi:DUF4012 domain-containing protein [Gordonia desulfuricans]|nr:DUF4012 domain-containing protein [Gordonia desulfuricans]